MGEGLDQRLYHRGHGGFTEDTGKTLNFAFVQKIYPVSPRATSVSSVVEIYFSQSFPSTMRLMPSFMRAT